MNISSRLAAFLLAIAAAGPAFAGEFKYSIPPGWRDLIKALQPGPGDKDVSAIPQPALADAAGGRFVVYAIDPANTDQKRVGSSFNAVEMPGKGRITEGMMESYAVEIAAQMRAAGLTAGLVDSGVISMNGADVGTVTLDLDSEQGGSRRLLQFMITGQKSSTVLTYAAPKDQFAQYLPAFRASARATQGGATAGGFSWKQMFAVGAFCGFVGLIIAFLRNRLAGTKHGEALEGAIQAATGRPAAPAAPPAKKVSYVWTCPGCGKPVPLRIDQCRCGTAKPA